MVGVGRGDAGGTACSSQGSWQHFERPPFSRQALALRAATGCCRWRAIDASRAWQKGAFDGLAVAYGALALVALVSAAAAARPPAAVV